MNYLDQWSVLFTGFRSWEESGCQSEGSTGLRTTKAGSSHMTASALGPPPMTQRQRGPHGHVRVTIKVGEYSSPFSLASMAAVPLTQTW